MAETTSSKLDRLKTLLRDMFQLDRGDLDFGLYRIMKVKSDEITKFLDDDLLPQVERALQLTTRSDRAELNKQLAAARKAAKSAGYDPDTNPSDDILELSERLAESTKDADAEADVYNHLANFFDRYYSEGDFISQRRHSSGGRSTYLIPYNGEEVKLHWANADQYYIKTTENYSSYIFTVGRGEQRVRLEIADADNEKDNVKEAASKQRRFVLASGNNAVTVEDKELIARFEHRPLSASEKKAWPGRGTKQQSRINESSVERILSATDSGWRALLCTPVPTVANKERTLLSRHVERYTAKNSFDYFIHKDLGGFLRRELDFYLSTDVLNVNDLEAGNSSSLDRALARVRAIRHLGRKIIDFLAQLEDYQKRVWLKKKFVLETHWCVTLDRVPESFYPEIAANQAQHEDWVKLLAVDEIVEDPTHGSVAWSVPPSIRFLRANPHLVVDTRFFDSQFTDRLMAALGKAGPLEDQLDGLLIHGENFQTLSLLRSRYRKKIKCVYIDPPYNSKTSQIAYKNSYKHSSWIALMESRLSLSRQFSTFDGTHVVAIDENEQEVLGRLLSALFPGYNKICVAVVHNKKGIQGTHFSYNHEYAFFCIPPGLKETNGLPIPEEDREFDNLRKWGRESERQTARNCFYPIEVRNNEIVGFGDVCPEEFHPGKSNVQNGESIFVYPIDSKGVERKWRYARGSVESIRHLLRVKTASGSGETQIEKCRTEKTMKTVWNDPRYIAGDYGTRWLTNLGLKIEEDLYPKSIHTVMDSIFSVSDENSTVLDYFAGSGTTGHAVIELNRADGGQRKYVLAEIGSHFHEVLIPRMKKIAHSSDWKDGKPVSRTGVSQFFKYISLESYEDALDNLEVTKKSDEQLQIFNEDPALAEDYELTYSLVSETLGSASLFGQELIDPFAYSLSVVRDGVRRKVAVDLPETFNFLMGLRVESRRPIEGVLAITGKDAADRNSLIIWRKLNEIDHEALDGWFDRNRNRFGASLERIYVNGDNTLNAMKQPGDVWTAMTIEPLFRELMFRK